MFKTAALKIAHNTTIPGLAGKQDLRSLQDLITAEKTVLNSYVILAFQIRLLGSRERRLQRLSTDFARAAEALRIWGQGEGDDLGVRAFLYPLSTLLMCKPLSSSIGHPHCIERNAIALHFSNIYLRQPRGHYPRADESRAHARGESR